ncbi:hypothetical protein Zm00014a_038392 [Zea mays]|uniref:Uncharacterized protein n=1 Tax=Zea mays TaxID=4577 RepID=A0A3L6EPQ3_MAIZE|nr:hypothetical protein Zm00014a_038392 [Zea mays]
MEEEAPPMELVREKKLSEKIRLCKMEVLKKSHTSVEDSDHIFLEWSGLQDVLSCKKDLHNCGTKASDEQH